MEFIASTKDLKKSLSVVSMAVGETAEIIQGHALFDVKDQQIFLYSTDTDRMAMAYLPVSDIRTDKDVQFTADPKRLQKIISCSDSDLIKFVYDEQTKTLNVFASEDSEAFVSFASFEPESFLTFDKDLESAKSIKAVDALAFLSGIKFMQGFLPDNDSNKKFSNLYIIKGVMYGSNGSFKIGAYESPDLEDTNITVRRIMLPSIVSLIDLSGTPEVIMCESEKIFVFSSKDELYNFAFRKTTAQAPKMPVSTDVPKMDGFTVDRNIFIKKLNRLSITSKDEFGIKMAVTNTDLTMETVTDRKSYEKMAINRISGDATMEFVLDCNKFKGILSYFTSQSVALYVDNSKCIVYNNGEVIVEESGKAPVKKSFKAVGLSSLAKVV